MQSLALLLTLAASAVAIWPIPTQYRHGNAVIWLASDVQMTFNAPSSNAVRFISNLQQMGGLVVDFLLTCAGAQPRSADAVNPRLRRRRDGPSGTAPVSAEVVQAAIRRTHDLIFNEKFVPWKFHPRNADFEPPLAEAKNHISSIVITQNSTDVAGTFKPLAGAVDESYTLEVTEDGRVKMTAVSSVGVLRALDTFTQLFFQHSGDKDKVYTNLAPLYIYDTPKFPHRGLNMDVARNWFPVDDLLHLIDAVSWNKFNRLHLHVTDSQSWPLEIPAIPELADKGAYRKGLSYSPADIERIQRHGTERGVEVFLEIDMPGHTASIAESFPDLITAYDMQPDWPTYANEPPSGQFKLDHPPVMEFLGKLFDDLLPRVSPHAAYFHTGGDEVNRNVYLLDDTVKSNDSAVIQPLLQKFLDGVHEKVRAKGLTPIVWEEMLLQWNLTLGDDVVVQTWQSNEAVADAVRKGHKTLAGNFNYWYLDCGKGQWVSPRDNGSVATPSVIAEPFADYCSPTKSWRQMYSYDPLFNIPAESTHLVLGGEVHMWNEQTDRVSLDHMVWPRAAAAAEVLWSGRKDTAGTNRSLLTAAPRLNEWRERLVARGVAAAPIQMIYCTQNDPSSCGQ
ncbi:MAG: N-acetyl-glucosamine-6-phosphate deacetylase [Thelocarpon impressellum]|nr:MAG: N-acetyl-glucosamine-6-phosphate deacetylase [Thelocarpon impressellum]